ncbi:hypothetical protein H2203_007205 [Taxawa tesnikishii (nom. ined.)]|nr:hypothetical protein H2203_007205 [Dothideales sp. JES 119]
MPEDPVLSDPEEEEERHEEDIEETAPKKRSGYGCQISRGYKALWREIDQLPSKMLDPNIANLMKKVLRAIDEDDEVFYRLVSYPYYCKYATGASKTEFRHLDNHPDCLLAGDGANMIQGTMSLVDETKDNCTVLIKGIHQHFEEWWHDVQERGGDKTSSRAVIRIDNKIWSKEDEEKYGLQWEEVSCKAGEARITLPYLLHSSNGGLVKKRVTVFPWYMAVKEDLSTLEINARAND